MLRKSKKMRIDYRHILSVLIILTCLTLVFFQYPSSIGRIVEAFRDLGTSLVFYFCVAFRVRTIIAPTVISLPNVHFIDFPWTRELPFVPPSIPPTIIPIEPEVFVSNWHIFWDLIVSGNNAKDYVSYLGDILLIICQFAMIILPLLFGLYILVKKLSLNKNNDYNRDTTPLRIWKGFTLYTYLPVKMWVLEFVDFLKRHKAYVYIFLGVWCINFNIITVVVEFFAYLFYFSSSFDLSSIYTQFYKLFLDLSVLFTTIPVWIWIIVVLLIFHKVRKNIGFRKLNCFERCNRGFINELPVVCMAVGTMAKGKTKAITDMALSQEVMFRNKAFELLLENDMKFPYFPWISLENEIKKSIKNHQIYNLATCRQFVLKLQRKFCKNQTDANIYGYDYMRYGYTYYDGLKEVTIWNVIKSYTTLYFLFIFNSSLLISNYGIRVDNVLTSIGNFPAWNTDFFKKDYRLNDAFSKHAHILDYDALRLGKRLVAKNPNKDMFEFGILVLTEIGKERGNNLENQEIKKNTGECNQKNDLFNTFIKMIRHSATVDNFCFAKIFADEQRPESWGADARDLCQIINIDGSSDFEMTMPFFFVEELLHNLVFNRFVNFYSEYRFNRSDNTLLMYLLKSVVVKFYRYYMRLRNTFNVCMLNVNIEQGTRDGEKFKKKYYIMSKKVHAMRYSTDCFSGFFNEKALRSNVGLGDLPKYASIFPSLIELKGQNSYFIEQIDKMFKVKEVDDE